MNWITPKFFTLNLNIILFYISYSYIYSVPCPMEEYIYICLSTNSYEDDAVSVGWYCCIHFTAILAIVNGVAISIAHIRRNCKGPLYIYMLCSYKGSQRVFRRTFKKHFEKGFNSFHSRRDKLFSTIFPI